MQTFAKIVLKCPRGWRAASLPLMLAVILLIVGIQRRHLASAPQDSRRTAAATSNQKNSSNASTPAFGIERRIPWTTSRVVGSPEPPQPYRVVKTFTKVEIKQPLVIVPEPGTDSLLVVQHLGSWAGPGPVLRIKDDPDTTEAEVLLSMNQIVYGLTLHPDFIHNGFVYLGSNGPVDGPNKTTRVTRYTIDRQPPHRCDPASEKVIIEWPSDGHNGGDLAFGPDGMLYVTSGDGTPDSDRFLTGQDISDLLGGVLRVDVDHVAEGHTYSIPPDNPFVDFPGARGELWAYGLRNPWRMTFDKRTGQLWVGNNGQDLWEQVYLIERGGNYGWSVYEGSHPFYLERNRGPTPIFGPAVEHSHAEARSLTGGTVYYGEKLPQLVGAYIYGDWSTGRIWGVRHDGKQKLWHQELAETTLQIGGFGCDHAGELIVIDQGGGFYRLEQTPVESAATRFPTRLSETGLFLSTSEYHPDPALIPYSVNAPVWADGALQDRYLGLPGESQIEFPTPRGWNCPEGTALVKTLSIQMQAGKPASRRRIETQLLARQQGQWQAYTYRWNDDETDAEVVPREGVDIVLAIDDPAAESGRHEQPWRFASRSECMACHSRAANFVLGLNELQMNRDHDYGAVRDNQLRTWEHLGLFRVNSLEYEKELHASVLDALENAGNKVAERTPRSHWTAVFRKYVPQVGWLLNAHREIVRHFAAHLREKLRDELTKNPVYITWLPKRPSQYRKLVDPYDEHADLNERARSYLHVNCSQCHVEAGGGNALMELEFTTATEKMNLLDATPRHATFGLDDARLVAAGDPLRSVLWYRVAKLGGGRMPRVGSGTVDEQGVRLLHDWIARLPVEGPFDLRRAAFRSQQITWLDNLSHEERAGIAQDALIDALLTSTSGALLLARAIDDHRLPVAVRREVVSRGTVHTMAEVRDLFERFLPPSKRTARLGNEIDAAALLAVAGDAQRGRKLWFNVESLQCKSCHRIGEGAERVGPDLDKIGKKLNRAQLLESILQPSRTIDPKFATYVLTTHAGQVYTGTLARKSDEQVILRDSRSQETRVAAAQVDSLTQQAFSMMPEFLLRDLTAQQAADLLSFLEGMK